MKLIPEDKKVTADNGVDAFCQWIQTSEGKDILKDGATGVYLENRLRRAFLKGVEAGKKIVAKKIADYIEE